MDLQFSSPRSRKDWLSYRKESLLSQGLDDRARIAQMQEMYDLYVMVQKTKSAERLRAEARAERRLNAWRLNPRYRALLEQAHGDQHAP